MRPWTLARRAFPLVIVTAVAAASLVYGPQPAPAVVSAAPEPAVVTETAVPEVDPSTDRGADEPAPQAEPGEGVAPSGPQGEPEAEAESPEPAAELTRSTATFSLLGVTWDAGSTDEDPTVEVRWRSVADGWSDWTTLETSPTDPASSDVRPGTDPLWVGESDGVDVRVSTPSGRAPSGVRVSTVTDGADSGVVPTAAAVGQPKIISRSAWGAKSGSSCSAPVYGASMLGTTLHHTAGSNSYTKAQSAGIVRATQAYHTGSQGWCDIGYNFLVDKYGQIFEGRKGGITKMVRGAHAGVTAANERTIGVSMMGNYDVAKVPTAMKTAVADLIAWRHSLAGLKATGTYSLGGKKVNRIMGHRDVKSTACPGRYGYAWLTESGGLRTMVANRLAGGSKPTPTPSATPKPTTTPKPTATPTPSASATAGTGDVSRLSSGKVALEGRGFGHGIGMSQYGAQGAAREGVGYATILSTYYPGTKRVEKGGSVRVLLSAATDPTVTVLPASSMRFRQDGKASTSLPTKTTRGTTIERWRMVRVASDQKRTVLQYREKGTWKAFRASWTGWGQFEVSGGVVQLVMPNGKSLGYRSIVRSAPPSSGSTKRSTVNVLTLENYLRGVVASEMPSGWKKEALKAQAVAARTYAARALTPSRSYDICDTTACQVYKGVAGETASTDVAVRETSGDILTYDGAPALTQYSSSSGGVSASGGQPYLKVKTDPYDSWSGNPNSSWTASVTASTIQKAFPSIGTFKSVKITKRSGVGAWGGRVDAAQVVGSKKTITVTGPELRFGLGLKSAYLRFR